MSSLIPWAEIETEYIKRRSEANQNSRAYSVRLPLGSLIIKEKLGLSDEETILTITENLYLQYFFGLHEFKETPSFHSSSMTHFRKRFNVYFINRINERIVQKQRNDEKCSRDDESNDGSSTSTLSDKCNLKNDATKNQGKLLLDATCATADITYPTDVGLLNNAREKLESMTA